ncbi:hypothetical protein F3Y22_tig00001825pilonHSYRG00128 [Hibiscus syriacus]|uniref:Histone acetyltransferase n=1 Tax=Hibiscus syriacus TaxID=106335 RepID=A0A6A3CTI7_HIBSY|nr:uncharacterized protein LOC120135726 [Hibiscus syriacus]XP_039007886.1 uncharacterized protein LOC120135726 [Hibiscus syriacus]KAE8732583.1 hypothetical protein F3Y22_tig00001825pilonHSYRG00128 [Hibiscus syriacus]
MPRPGPRPYVCERRAWHSDRHQPMRGSLIQEIFRVVNEIHSSATKKNKEWQEKLPVVVLKAEEIMYSKANSEAEYMDIKILWDRTNDAINTIIRRDESTETGELIQPCIEAALNLGCTARRTLRSQRNCSSRCYLNPVTQKTENTTQGNFLTNSHCMASYSGFIKHTTMNVVHMGTEAHKHIAQNGDRATNKISFPYKNDSLPSNVEKHAPSMYSVYPLFYGNHPKVEELQHSYGISTKSISNTVEPAKMGVICDIFSPDVDSSSKMNHTDVRNTSNNPHEITCDLSLRLGPLSTPCPSTGNSPPKEIENSGSTFLEWNRFSHLTSPIDKSLSSFPRSNRDAPLNSSSNKWSLEGGHLNVDATLSKRKAVYAPPANQQFCLPLKLPCCYLTERMKHVGS